ncbi:TraI/MobA(P) family conjugative relaxase [Ralstonia insidiosa]|uniref:Relaxase/mobilization nuclease domain-containing protein n=1 Tax=Ralstonia insidiosa TaxID=190721 RepID=A0A848P3S8_9RALS|nr:TraI/MobA(P) family conjugative relaxase [Ralstonia insidiosa]NMV39863.1 relaxase/mobilization nuclease domain-containing protein [Ralstonia insidiosa]
MIVKVPKNRRDGRSSFKDLSKYITEGIENQAAPPTTTSWDRLTQYITQESVLDAMGSEVEKTIGVEIGNVASLATAPAEMYAVAKKNARAKNPVYHYILSWPENEHPEPAQIFEAVRHTLRALGMEEHQYIAAIHANTDNIHAHVEVNRVHPQTFKAIPLGFDHKTLHRAAREIELRFGWQHDPGLFKVIEVAGRKLIVEDDNYVDPDLALLNGKAAAVETWSGEQSLQEWCAEVPAPELRKVLNNEKTTSWQDVHRVLLQHGLELRDAGGGGMVIADVSRHEDRPDAKPVVVAASKAFRFLKRADLENRFGPFQPPNAEAHSPAPTHTYKRDPLKRLQRKLERKALRDDLRARFDAERTKARAVRTKATEALAPLFEEDKKRLEAIQTDYQAARKRIQADTKLNSKQKQQAYMLLKMTTDKIRLQVRESIQRERDERRALLPPVPTWRAWVEELAQTGDPAAISALRGMVYQEGRDKRKASELADEAREESEARQEAPVNAIRPATARETDPYARAVQNLIWKVSNNGNVQYSFAGGGRAFVDQGGFLTYGRKDVDDQALMVSLRYADSKWPGGIRLTGGDMDFKRRAVRLATELGIRVANAELQALQRDVQSELSAARKQLAVMSGGDNVAASIAEIEHQVRLHDPKARSIAHVGGSSGRYRGRIIAQTATHVAQQVDRHAFVVHDKSAFRKAPATGAEVTVAYRAGRATATEAKSRTR